MKNLVSLVAEMVDEMHKQNPVEVSEEFIKNHLGNETIDQDLLDHTVAVLLSIQRNIEKRQNSPMGQLRYNEVTGEFENLWSLEHLSKTPGWHLSWEQKCLKPFKWQCLHWQVRFLHWAQNMVVKEYQIRNGEEILFRCDSWRTVNALLDRCPDGSYIYEDVFYDDEPNLNI